MRKIIKEIRLKKDTPDHRAGELFVLMSNNGIYEIDAGEDDPAVFYGGDIKNFDEWFEKVEESVEWLHDGASYYQPAVSGLARKFVPSYNEYCGDDAYDEARRRIGICYKSRAACQRFIDFLTAIEVVSHDEGFMKISRKINYDTYGYAISHSDWNKSLIAEKVESINHAGQFYFDTSEHAEASLDKHRDEWRTILDYDWSRG